MPKLSFTNASVEKIGLPDGKRQVLYTDSHENRVRGLGLLVGRTSKSWTYQRDLAGGITRRVKLGEYPAMCLQDARQAAIKMGAKMLDGIDPRAERRATVDAQQLAKWQQVTLQNAVDHHVLNMEAKGCSPRSIDGLKMEMPKYLPDWINNPLMGITPEDAVKKHRSLSKDNGPYLANRVFRNFRACYRDLRKVHHQLPPSPADAVTFNKEKRRRDPIVDLAGWWDKVTDLENPIRRDFYRFVLLTGLRSENARMLKWGYIDFKSGTVTSPDEIVKGDKGFRVPLSAHVLKMLGERKMDNSNRGYSTGDDGWVFPTRDTSGKVTYMQEAKQQAWAKDANGSRLKNDKGKPYKISYIPTPHRCRDTFITTAMTVACVDAITVKALANHALPTGDVTVGYVRPPIEHLRAATEKITAAILGLAGVDIEPVANAKKSA